MTRLHVSNSIRALLLAAAALSVAQYTARAAQECVPSAPDGYSDKACTVTVDRNNPASPPTLVVHGGTKVTIHVINARGNEAVSFTPTTTKVAPPDIAGTFLKSAITPLQNLVLAQHVATAKVQSALGAAAAAGMFLGRGSQIEGQQPTYWYYDSFGNVVAADPAVIAGGVYPPPLPAGVEPPGSSPSPDPPPPSDETYVTAGYTRPNILLIMVDELRFPRWLTGSQQSVFKQSIMPHVYGTSDSLILSSFSFPNYFVAATACTPSRCTLLTGLYAQQTCMFTTQGDGSVPSLQPYHGGNGFATIGDVLNQGLRNGSGSGVVPPYDTAWIGKWHVSGYDFSGPGSDGPADYGFTSSFNIPTAVLDSTYPAVYQSPNGLQNEGAGGDSLGNSSGVFVYPFTYNTLATPADPTDVNDHGLNIYAPGGSFYQLSDAAIYHAFHEHWLPAHTNMSPPWFLGLSFVNPHDITWFPWAYGLATNANGEACGGSDDFGCATDPSNAGYYPPAVLGWQDTYNATISLNGLPFTMYNASSLPPSDWNNTDDPMSLPYNMSGVLGGKPGLQGYFENFLNSRLGSINTINGWCTFLNYYYWMQNLTDTLIGLVLDKAETVFAGNTPIIIFTSDHGDFGGSHNLRTKGGALYDESINVPLLIKWPTQEQAYLRGFACSSVDILPFIYTAAIGNSSWRMNPNDMISYLSGREPINDFIFNASTAAQRRLVLVPNSSGAMVELPYILHTTDDYPNAHLWNNSSVSQPGHAIALRTVDNSFYVDNSAYSLNFYGGAKLGMYTYWLPCSTYPNTSAEQQFEYYDYYRNNYRENGNSAFDSGSWNGAGAGAYLNAYNNIMAAELYLVDPKFQTGYNTAFNDCMVYLNLIGDGPNAGTCMLPMWPPMNILAP